MPRVQAVPTLVELCSTYVAHNVEQIRSKYSASNSKSEPFNCIPDFLLMRIIDIVRKEEKYNVDKLDCLMTEHLSFLDLSGENIITLDSSEHFLPTINRCKSIRKLNISNQPSDCLSMPRLYENGFPFFSQLRVLDLSRSQSRDDSLLIIGKFCKDLRELDVSGNEITDFGIRALCVSNNLTETGTVETGRCTSLVKLNITKTRVSQLGVQLALENLPFLKFFGCRSNVQALTEINRNSVKLGSSNRFVRLLDLYCRGSSSSNNDYHLRPPYVTGSLSIAILLCPFVTRVEIENCRNLYDSDLHALINLKNLRKLIIDQCENVTFNGGVLPVLQHVGITLDTLCLKDMTNIGILPIAEFCPNLRILDIEKIVNDDQEQQQMEWLPMTVFRKLERVHLVDFPALNGLTSTEEFVAVLSSPRLVSVDLEYCILLTDDLMERAHDIHQFRNLEKLKVFHSPQITCRGIGVLMNSENALKELKLFSCSMISGNFVDKWIRRARRERWSLLLKFI